jgi:signal transduction histidine kinase
MSAAEPDARGHSGLARKLGIAVVVLAALLLALLLGYVGPNTMAEFRDRGETLLQHGTERMQQLAKAQQSESDGVLVNLIEHTTEARRRSFEDLPLDLYENAELLRDAVRGADEAHGDKLQKNVAMLADETRRRANQRIDAAVAELRVEQQAMVEATARELRDSHLWFLVTFLLLTATLLGFGLWRIVVRPVAQLRSATHRVADGDLTAVVAAGSNDELGALAKDFSRMVEQLAASRASLDAMNAGLEEQVREKTRELARAERMAWIGTFAGGIAHEFHNLIGGIRGCAHEARLDETDPERQETLDVILRAADRATSITRQLLQFARQGERRHATTHKDVDLRRVVDDAVQLLEPEARRRGVSLRSECREALPTIGSTDELHQVLVNLLTNALQATPKCGSVVVQGYRREDSVAVTVADTGVGIDSEDLDRVFEPFFSRRGDDLDPNQRGTGLGLAVSFGIAETHGGSIHVVSRVGHGSSFTLQLPAAGTT